MDFLKNDLKIVFKTSIKAILLSFIFLFTFTFILTNKSFLKSFGDNKLVELAIVSDSDDFLLNQAVNIVKTHEAFDKTINLQVINEKELEKYLENGKLDAYVLMPDSFIDSILSGENLSPDLYLAKDKPIKVETIKFVANAADSLLINVQNGVYATIDVARENSLPSEYIDKNIVMPINLAYVEKLLKYDEMMDSKVLEYAHGLDIYTYYLRSFAIFISSILLIAFASKLKGLFQEEFLDIYTANSLSKLTFMISKIIAIFIVLSLSFIPLFKIFKLYYFVYILFLTLLLIFSILYIKDSSANALFILFFSSFSLFLSGGLIPTIILPKFIAKFSVFVANFHIIRYEENIAYVFLFITVLLALNIYKINKYKEKNKTTLNFSLSFKSYFLNSFKYSFKKYLNYSLIIVISLYLVTISSYSYLSKITGGNKLKIAVYSANERFLMEKYIEDIEENITVEKYDDLELMKKDLMQNKIAAAYDFSKDRPVSYESNFTNFSKISSLSLASVIISEEAGEISYNILKNHLDISKEKIILDVQNANEIYSNKGRKIEINYKYFSSNINELSENKIEIKTYINLIFSISLVLILFNSYRKIKNENYFDSFLAMGIDIKIFKIANLLTILLIVIVSFLLSQLLSNILL